MLNKGITFIILILSPSIYFAVCWLLELREYPTGPECIETVEQQLASSKNFLYNGAWFVGVYFVVWIAHLGIWINLKGPNYYKTYAVAVCMLYFLEMAQHAWYRFAENDIPDNEYLPVGVFVFITLIAVWIYFNESKWKTWIFGRFY